MEILMLAVRPTEEPADAILPALGLLPHTVRIEVHDPRSPLLPDDPDAILVDARRDLLDARGACHSLRAVGLRIPLLAVVHEASLVAMSPEWRLDDVILAGAGPAEVEARLRLSCARLAAEAGAATRDLVTAGELVIDPRTYSVKLKGRRLDLTYKEFELLKFLAQHPGRVFTRDRLLREVWGFDYFGGHRTVDVHVRRLRAKLGSEYESMIGTVRQVGYKLVLPPPPKPGPLLDDWTLAAGVGVASDL